MLGKEAWENNTAQGIAILTQIGEMSINISADFMLCDLCPIDRLIQRVGRLCRFDKSKIGELHILIPQKKGLDYPAPYGAYDRKEKVWHGTEAFDKTKKYIKCEEFSTEKLVKMLNEIYNHQSEFSVMALSNAKNLHEYFKTNWLINSKQISRKDDSSVNFWKSRNIPPQEVVFVDKPSSEYFTTQMSFESWKIKNSIEIPVYLVEMARKNNMIDLVKIIVKDDTEIIYLVKKGFYSFETGLDFKIPDQILG